ncbi:hypothetical protein [Rhizobium sp. Root1204]|uniref:hypothetical protein n=1 Tax=Rhizobium sp. Root1204 TaxID=1736428 RepID=UPI000712CAE6|nr:hypothetical protein [Rhizobium sp. Root1204]KQV41939.1 hypothetical protein ASC96_00835 [Rhizobium sp. Root1204]
MHDEYPRIKKDDLQADYPGVFDAALYTDVGVGWLGLVHAFVEEALPHDPSLAVYEIKEKWGQMRLWTDTPVLEAKLARGKVEIKSALVCEVCGEPGYVRRPPPGRMAWWRCRCDEHASDDQRSWPRRDYGALGGMMQVRGQWYRYDEAADAMIETKTPEFR